MSDNNPRPIEAHEGGKTRTGEGLNVLRVDASARSEGSSSRKLGDRLLERLHEESQTAPSVKHRDVAKGLPFVDEEWVGANFTDPSERTDRQKQVLELSDDLVGELREADVLIIGSPIYNFGIPASLKAWIDLIARARETFRYTENGPVGLLEGKKAYVLMASGGTRLGSEIDFASGYLRHILGFVGIHDVEVIAADRGMARGGEALEMALAEVDQVELPSLQLAGTSH